jgi:predicted nuclease of restriction endonuclease-like (RecB) superfamily
LNQVKAKAYKKQVSSPKTHNFRKALPVHLSEQAHEILKSEYTLSFLGINEPLLERELENKLVAQIRDFILELGYGFAYIGNQYKLSLRNKEYFVDLLFYHRKLKCLVAIDLKIGAFEPEFAGKMNFYLNLLNKQMRMPEENPSIGIILCAEKDYVEVEYALSGMTNPIGVAEYSYQKKLPANLRGELPGAAELKKKVAEGIKKSGRNA